MKEQMFGVRISTACLIVTLSVAAANAHAEQPASWNEKAAAAYLDERQGWWMSWPRAAREDDTFCVSCHTALPYALARSTLRPALGEDGPAANERALLDNVSRRVRAWKDIGPFYSDARSGVPKTSESRGTEAILNALILARRDAQEGTFNDTTREGVRPPVGVAATGRRSKGSVALAQFSLGTLGVR